MHSTIIEDATSTFKILLSFFRPSRGRGKEEKEAPRNALSFADPHCYNFSRDVTVKRREKQFREKGRRDKGEKGDRLNVEEKRERWQCSPLLELRLSARTLTLTTLRERGPLSPLLFPISRADENF